MRSDGPQMEMADRNAEPILCRASERTRLVHLLGVEIDMGMEIANLGHAPEVGSAADPHKLPRTIPASLR